MADKQKTIDIIFGGVDKTGSALNSVSSRLDALETNVGSVTGPLADITDSILKLDAALAAAAIGLTGYAIKLADDFGTSFAEIATLIGEPASSLQGFKDQIQAYAEQSGQSFDEITNATYNAISAGVDYKDSLDLIAEAEKLSLSGRADLGVTTKALVSTLNAFGAEMSEAGDYADIFFTTVQKGQTTLPELANNIGKVAPLAAQAGLSFGELGSAIAAITAGAGISTSEAITALQASITSLIKPSKDATDLAAELGLEFNSTALRSKGLSGVLADVKTATGGNVDQMARLFGSVESLKAVLPLTGTAADDFGSILQAMEARTGSAGRAAKELEADLGRLTQTLQNNVSSALISFGDNFTDETAGIIQSLSSMFNTLGDEIELDNGAFAPIIQQLEGLFQDIENKFRAMAANLPEALDGLDLRSLVGAFDGLSSSLGGAFRALFGEIDLTTVKGLESALQTVVDALSSLVRVSAGIIDGLKPLFEIINEGASAFQDLSDGQKSAAGELFGLGKAINSVLPIVGTLGDGVGALGNGLIALAGASGFKTVIQNLDQIKSLGASAGKIGLIGTALFGGYEAGNYINEQLEEYLGKPFGIWLHDKIRGSGAPEQLENLKQKLKDTADATTGLAEAEKKAQEAFVESTKFKQDEIDALNKQIEATIEAKSGQKELTDQIAETTDKQKEYSKTVTILENGYDAVTGKVNSWTGVLKTNSDSLTTQADRTKDVLKQTEQYQMKLEELASNERIAAIEAKVSINVAEIEAQSKQAVAIIESMNTTINSTGNLLGELFGEFNNASKFDKLAISKQIEKENANREKALQIQNELAQEQIKLIRAKTQAITKGDSIIKISAEGLTPALELIFNEVMRYSQIRATEEGLDLLLGV